MGCLNSKEEEQIPDGNNQSRDVIPDELESIITQGLKIYPQRDQPTQRHSLGRYIQEELETQYGPHWQVILGLDFNLVGDLPEDTFASFQYDQYKIVILKTAYKCCASWTIDSETISTYHEQINVYIIIKSHGIRYYQHYLLIPNKTQWRRRMRKKLEHYFQQLKQVKKLKTLTTTEKHFFQ